MAKRPRITVNERSAQAAAVLASDPRYQRGIDHPFGLPSEAIRLKEPGWYCRWVNSAILSDKVWRNKNIGYDNVRLADLADPEQIGMLSTDPSGNIVRGERGHDVLMKLPDAVYQARQAAKVEKNLSDMRDASGKQRKMLGEAAKDLGGNLVGNVQTSYERIETTEEAGDE